jgi:omega-6 fatty acid desaturase (delta-12 desaturase)
VGVILALPHALWPLELSSSLLLPFALLRLFVFLHDAEHGAIFRRQRLGRVVVWSIGLVTMIAPPVWREFHNFHHATTGKLLVGDPRRWRGGDRLNRVMTVETARTLDFTQRWAYLGVRHPVGLALGYVVAFVLGACVSPFLRSPRDNWSGLVILVLHLAGHGVALWLLGWDAVLAFALPSWLGGALGAYLFYVQHAADGVEYRDESDWDFVHAATHGSTFFEMPPALHWLTGNLGFHHVHHLNPRIPFYRLPDAMASIEALQTPPRTSWRPKDIARALRLHTWDEAGGHMAEWP